MVLLIVCVPTSGLFAQSVADDIEQLLLDVQKLTSLKQILSQMYSEYETVFEGYEDIKGLSQGTYALHKIFLDGLLAVNPAVASYKKVPDIISKEEALVRQCQAANTYLSKTNLFSSGELTYFSNTYAGLLKQGSKNLTELYMVITGGELRMGDASRLSAIDRIDADMTGRLTYLRGFNDQAGLAAAQRNQEAADISTVRALMGVGQ
jgi:hypothetical protein